ncbi:10930_t:CDS:2 [Paraglomus brasilianum]|uniref:10930_t:CDS:1 n=1 Tax=Paraglomus brasilianum TaxID=144538 RepID=A0A9N9BGX4_9GLOM|nr:10930_t:CDS:2 [Paraglomus brasilianum]
MDNNQVSIPVKGQTATRPENPTGLIARSANRPHSDVEFIPSGHHRYPYGYRYWDNNSHPHIQHSIQRREALLRRLAHLIAVVVIGLIIIYAYFTNTVQYSPGRAPITTNPDGIILYRVLGNDLPPRHKAGQILQNVRFILNNEPKFPNTRKVWLLNRIVDEEYENALIQLLNSYEQEYLRIPFEISEYQKKDFRLEDFPKPDFFHSDDYLQYPKIAKLRTIDYTYADKNLYAMNNVSTGKVNKGGIWLGYQLFGPWLVCQHENEQNGGRNAALAHGKKQPDARWVMPFDGNCFLTMNAFKDIEYQLRIWGEQYKYFVVPMARLLNNTELLTAPDVRPLTPEEPQVIFRNDAELSYNPDMRYGRRSKLELLGRLGVLSPRKMNFSVFPWEADSHRAYTSPEKRLFKTTGWVFRLFSGQAQQEHHRREAYGLRAFNRLLGIQEFLDTLDERVAKDVQRFDPNKLFVYNENGLKAARLEYWSGEIKVKRIVDLLIKKADEMVNAAMERFKSVIPNEQSDDHLVMESKASSESTSHDKENPIYAKYSSDNEWRYFDLSSTDYPTTSELFENVTTLALANYFTNDVRYGRWSSNLIRAYMLSSYALDGPSNTKVNLNVTDVEAINDQGYLFPNLHVLPRSLPKVNRKVLPTNTDIMTLNPSSFLDGVRLLYKQHTLSHSEYTTIKGIATQWLETLINSSEGLKMNRLGDHRSTLYDLQVASLSGFVDDIRSYLRVINRCRMKIGKQFQMTEALSASVLQQPYEQSFANDLLMSGEIMSSEMAESEFHYSTLNIYYWLTLIRGVQNYEVGFDIWHHTAKRGQRLSRAIISHFNQYSNHVSDGTLIPMLQMAQTAHKTSDAKRGIWHEHGDEHDYYQYFLKKIGGKMNVFLDQRPGDDGWEKELSRRIGIGESARWDGIIPFWMFGVA